ncbi:MAG: RNA polymerase factor sigma-54 [Victivallaceae bacterium]|nr:RNA polymerase factor sigma-54 [Victivallaceae bacterium]
MSPENGFGLQQRVEQEQILSPQQRQALEFLQAPAVELQTKINAALEQNPMLELDDGGRELAAGDLLGNAFDQENARADGELDEDERDRMFLTDNDRWRDSLDSYLPEADSGEAAERARKRDFVIGNLTRPPSAQATLLEQLAFTDAAAPVRAAAAEVIGSLDANGFLTATDREIASGAGVDEAAAHRAVELVRTFEPSGIAARTLPEALLIQLDRRNVDDPVLRDIVTRRLDDVARNQLPQLARHFRISLEELKQKLAVLRTLSWRPGAALDGGDPEVLIPEFIVRNVNGTLVVLDNPGASPRLSVSGNYAAMLEAPDTPADAKKFLREKKQEADQLIRCLSMRETTLRRITELLVSEQYDFFLNGPSALRPLTMARVADKLDRDESTVSRALSGKYLGTPFGVLEYKFFFSGGYTDAGSGEQLAANGVRERIRTIIAAEDGARPLSDDKISRMLAADGIAVARRTVAKYREQLGILTSNLRKKY